MKSSKNEKVGGEEGKERRGVEVKVGDEGIQKANVGTIEKILQSVGRSKYAYEEFVVLKNGKLGR